ncbi:MAG: DUF4189 domain-containing protein [Hyphomicrobiaceae bacterium]|nr:MAG: DUF4189 domain-containing protein [Hyphomicrobiaceae bacterium]
MAWIAGWALALVLVGADVVGPARAQDKTPGSEADIAFWNSVKDSRVPAEIKAYLDAFPNGTFAELARIRLQNLAQQPNSPTPRPPEATDSALTSEAVIREVQQMLYNLNYELASVNGRLTDETRRAIRAWQNNTKRSVTGDLDGAQLAALRSARPPAIWGALAYSARGASGVVWNRPSRMEAERDALLECRKRGGKGCKVVTAAEKGCGALGFYTGRVGSTQHYGAYASVRPTLGQATDNALSECRRQARKPDACGVRMTFCADGSHKN